MKVDYSHPRVVTALKMAPEGVRKAFFKQIRLLANGLRHPSLRAKKYDESQDLWQARVNQNWCFCFVIMDDTVLDVIPHSK